MKRKCVAVGIVFLSLATPISRTESQTSSNKSVDKSKSQEIQPAQSVTRIPRPSYFVPQRQEFRKKMLQMFDANHDGKIDDNERLKMREARHNRRTFEGIDGPNVPPDKTNSANNEKQQNIAK